MRDFLRRAHAPAGGGHKKLPAEPLALKRFAYCETSEPEPAYIMTTKVEPRRFRNAKKST